MSKNKLFFLLVITIILSIIFLTHAYGVNKDSMVNNEKNSADLIIIDSIKELAPLSRPGVLFFHENHVKALEKENKDCSTCHLKGKDDQYMSMKFKRIKDFNSHETMDIYHNNCIECHKKIAERSKKSGPVSCGECHIKNPSMLPSVTPFGFDKSLHYRHTKALENKCERCHHDYDKKTEKLFYAKGKEGSCRYCHGEVKKEKLVSMKSASHMACIDCHMKMKARGEKTGNVSCINCHDAEKQGQIKKVDSVERIKRKQPDVVMILTGEEDTENRMDFVPFDHLAHETYNDSCRVCHHKDMKSCNKCHKVKGTKDSDWVTLEQSMHNLNAKNSCKGCHKILKKESNCAGCHASIPPQVVDNKSCNKCHMKPINKITTEKSEDLNKIAESMLSKTKKINMKSYSKDDIPKKVVIGKLSKEYEPVDFPHSKISDSISDRIKESKLAEYFHGSKNTLCQGCHHNSPDSSKPPKCIACHDKPFKDENLSKPGIKGAYHIQCMECHKEMGVKKPSECIDCHKRKRVKNI